MKHIHTEQDIEHTLTGSRPALTSSSRERLWSRISEEIAHEPVVSPFFPFMFTAHRRLVTALAAILLIVVGTGGVSAAAEASRPGDLLFPVERAFEDARLKAARTETTRETLRARYTEERLRELREIIEEEGRLVKVDEHSALAGTPGTLGSLTIEALVFSDLTTVTVEFNDEKKVFTTDAQTRDAVAEFILEQYPMLTKGQVESSLTLTNEDRGSRPKDRGELSFTDNGKVRVGSAVTEVLTLLDGAGNENGGTLEYLEDLRAEVDGLEVDLDEKRLKKEESRPGRFEWKQNDEGSEHMELREGNSRVRIEEKNGKIRINIEDDGKEEVKGESTVQREKHSDERDEKNAESSSRGGDKDED